MHENCGDDGKALGREHPLSFKDEAERLFFSKPDDFCRLERHRAIFPDQNNISTLAAKIDGLGA